MLSNSPESMAATLGLTEQVIQMRLHAIGLTDERREKLSLYWKHVTPSSNEFVRRLYERFLAIPHLRGLLASESRVTKLMGIQANYLRELFCREIKRDYVLDRISIGMVHHRIRITPQWYLASYAHFLVEHIDILISNSPSADEALDSILTLFQTVLFDASLVLDAYGLREDAVRFENDLSSVNGHESVRPEMKTGWDGTQRHTHATPDLGMSRISLTSEETDTRREFLGITQADLDRLSSLKKPFETTSSLVLEEFYSFIAQSPELAKLVPPHQVERLIKQVRSYWQEFLDGKFDRPYAASRMRVGVIHEHIGIDPQLYLMGLARQVMGFLRGIPTERNDFAEVLKSFFKAILFDVTFIIDAYMESRAETLLRTEGYANQLLSTLDTAVVVMDSQNRIQFANKVFVSLVGVEPSMLCRMRLQDVLDLKTVPKLFSQLKLKGEAKATSIETWDARLFRVSLMDLDERTDRSHRSFALLLDDVSSVVRISRNVEKDEAKQNDLVNIVSAVLWEMDLATKTIYTISRPAIDLTGHRDIAFLGKPDAWFNCIVEEDRQRFFMCCASLDIGAKASCDYRMLRPEGEQIWVRSHVTRVFDGSSDTRIAAVTMDISQSRRSEQMRMTAIGQVAGGIAHVINNALTVLVGNIELQSVEMGGLSSLPLLQNALVACNRTATVVKQLQAFAGGQILRPTTQSLNEAIGAQLSRLQELMGSTINIETSFEESIWKSRFDGQLFSNALEHICTNARDAMSLGGTLQIRTRNVRTDALSFDDPGFNREWVELQIVDSGCGMTEAVRKRAVEPFFSTRSLAERTGLGLSLVYGFMTQSGGHLIIESQLGAGTALTLRFPKHDSERFPTTTSDQDSSKPSVLVVDDDEAIVDAIAMQVRYMGFEVKTAMCGSDAFKILERTQIDILLSDIYLGDGINGTELAHRIVSSHPNIKVVLMSGYAKEDISNQELLPEWKFLPKPFSSEQLRAALQTLGRSSKTKSDV